MLYSRSMLREGFEAGLIGAGAVAAWFLIVDTMTGRPFYTPAVLGSALFQGLRDPALVNISVQPVLTYSVVHVAAFLFAGLIIAVALAEAEKSPTVLWLLAEFFVVFQFAFYAAVALAFTPLLAALAWINVALGNLIAAAAMGYYYWRVHPTLRFRMDADDPPAPTAA